LKIVSIVGRPREAKGNTASLLRIVLDGAESEGAENEWPYEYEYWKKYC